MDTVVAQLLRLGIKDFLLKMHGVVCSLDTILENYSEN